MGHKRYVVKNGKVYGPYIYESYRDSHGNVKKRYLGRHRDIKRANIPFVMIMILLMLVSFFMLVSVFLKKFF
jgi:hypothetical protein